MTPDWYINELTHAGSEHLDSDYVQQYDQKAGLDADDELQLLLSLGLNATHTLVDLGAGTGAVTLAAATICQRVVAVDVSPAMINVLRDKVQAREFTQVECVQSGFLTYHHQGDLADFVYSRHALHHLTDFWKVIALKRMAAILKPGGVLHLRDLIYSCEPDETEQVLETWLGKAPENADQGWTRAELKTHIQEEHSTYSWLLETMLERVGFDIQQVQPSPTRVHSRYTCVKR